jgi:hypothetical protein
MLGYSSAFIPRARPTHKVGADLRKPRLSGQATKRLHTVIMLWAASELSGQSVGVTGPVPVVAFEHGNYLPACFPTWRCSRTLHLRGGGLPKRRKTDHGNEADIELWGEGPALAALPNRCVALVKGWTCRYWDGQHDKLFSQACLRRDRNGPAGA